MVDPAPVTGRSEFPGKWLVSSTRRPGAGPTPADFCWKLDKQAAALFLLLILSLGKSCKNMFRPTVLLNAAARAASLRPAVPVSRVVAPAAFTRLYSAGSGLSQADIEARVLEILKGFDKVDPNKVNSKHRAKYIILHNWLITV